MVKNLLRKFFVILIVIAFSFGRASASYDAETEKFFGIINDYRVLNGHVALKEDSLLQNAANWMSEDMILNCIPKGTCTHTDSLGRTVYQRLQFFGYNAGSTNTTFRGGEIIAWGSSGLGTAERAFALWRNSAVHNENMLRDSYAALGISRTCDGSHCAWVVDFGGKLIQPFVYSLIPTPIPTATITPTPSVPSVVEGTPTPTPTLNPTGTPVSVPVLSPTITPTPPVPSVVEGIPLQTSTPTLTSTPTPTLSPLPNPQNFPDGALIREKAGIDVYIVKYIGAKKFKRLILSPSVFTHYSHFKWSDVRDVDRSVVDSFLTSDLVRAEGDTKVYKLSSLGDTGEKRWIPTQEIFNRLELDWDSVYQINLFDRDSYVIGVDLL